MVCSSKGGVRVEEEKSCTISFGERGELEVVFTGDWIRRDLDAVHHAMFKNLLNYLTERRKNLEG